jgi:hypothetical protein
MMHELKKLGLIRAPVMILEFLLILPFTRYLHVNPMHENPGSGTPYVALFLMLSRKKLKRGDTVHAVFELSIYNHSKGMYCGCQGI